MGAGQIENGFQLVRELFDRQQIQKSRAALEGMERPENGAQGVGVVGLGLQHEHALLDVLQVFERLRAELDQQLAVARQIKHEDRFGHHLADECFRGDRQLRCSGGRRLASRGDHAHLQEQLQRRHANHRAGILAAELPPDRVDEPFEGVAPGQDEIDDLLVDLEFGGARQIEDGLQLVGQILDRQQIQKSRAALEGVERAENGAQRLGIVGLGFQHQHALLDVLQMFLRFRTELDEQLTIALDVQDKLGFGLRRSRRRGHGKRFYRPIVQAVQHGAVHPVGPIGQLFDRRFIEDAGGFKDAVHRGDRAFHASVELRREFGSRVLQLQEHAIDGQEAKVLAGLGEGDFEGDFSDGIGNPVQRGDISIEHGASCRSSGRSSGRQYQKVSEVLGGT